MKIIVDLDGVVVRYDFKALVWEYFRIDIEEKSIFAYDLPDVLGVAPVMINTMFKKQVYGKPNFIEGALDTLTEWLFGRHEILIYSNRVKYMQREGLEKWLVKWQIPFSYIDDGYGKYDVHIDDSPGKLMATDSKVKLLYTQPWNERCLNITKTLIRIRNWKEIRNYV
ncbi:MAG: hypothetical protein V1709_06425 [Planctomycetota bacterium]